MEEDDQPTATGMGYADLEATTRDTRLGPGTEVHGYVIDGEIGKGGMGFVYSATHPLIGKRAAIKILKPEVSSSPIVLERFIQEARAVNKIGHPNIIDIFAFGTLPDGRAYHVMDLLVGETLRKRLRRGPMHPSEAASMIEQTSQALSAAHECGFVHRDLKPDNIFLVELDDRWPDVKLLDFGLAKLMPEGGIAPFTTKIGVMLGTPEYMSPEQARGVGVDYRTDVYALGIMTFEVLAGYRPFPSLGDPMATLLAHAEVMPPSLGDVVSGLPVELVQLVDAMLAKEPGARPSLAAVRTVIKRLRSTQLPTRTAAGLELSSFQGVARAPPPAASMLGVRASHVGAAPVLAHSLEATVRSQDDLDATVVPSQELDSTVRAHHLDATESAPDLDAATVLAQDYDATVLGPSSMGPEPHTERDAEPLPRSGSPAPHPQHPAPLRHPTHPPHAQHPAPLRHGTPAPQPQHPQHPHHPHHPHHPQHPHQPAPLRHNTPAPHPQHPAPLRPGTQPPGAQRANAPTAQGEPSNSQQLTVVRFGTEPPTTNAPAKSTHGSGRADSIPPHSHAPGAAGLAATARPPLPGTQLGVPPPPRIVAPPHVEGSARAPTPARRHVLWLIVAALLAIAAGVALAFVVGV